MNETIKIREESNEIQDHTKEWINKGKSRSFENIKLTNSGETNQ